VYCGCATPRCRDTRVSRCAKPTMQLTSPSAQLGNPLARASVFVAAVRPITRASVVVTRPAAHPIISHPIQLTCSRARVYSWLLWPDRLHEHSHNSTCSSRDRFAPDSITRSLTPEYSHNETCSPPDHIAPNLRAHASALMAAVRPVTRMSVVVTRPAAHPVVSHPARSLTRSRQNTATMRLAVHPITLCPTRALVPVHLWLLCTRSLARA